MIKILAILFFVVFFVGGAYLLYKLEKRESDIDSLKLDKINLKNDIEKYKKDFNRLQELITYTPKDRVFYVEEMGDGFSYKVCTYLTYAHINTFTIKTFTTDSISYNKMMAEELCEKLNEKLID
jgi:hypothetical protein